ncbi:Phosphoribosyl 1,2-cyclic phosphodiesterase [Lachnospiraceae bacterium NE2001]|nr:Phosphoribosyl 1,2-cyclic phosphodiesterase [Lachnospiraceae bacterium NE2001]
MKLLTLASGSSGNCTYIGTDRTSLLLDVGISLKNIEFGLTESGVDPSTMDGILITHEHSDHIKCLGIISRKYNIPIYATAGTIAAIKRVKALGDYDHSLFMPIERDSCFDIGDIRINTSPISHDAADPVCYSFKNRKSKVSVATDLGVYDEKLVSFLSESDAMVIEANHDIRMLEVGPYPYQLKQRILGNKGHLCNEASGQLVKSLLNDHLKAVFLGHLSDKNNYPELAFAAVEQELKGNPFSDDVRDFGLEVAPRYTPSKIIEV